MAKLDTYQKLVVEAINEYGTGDWKNWISVHYVHESGYSNIICHSEIIGKVFYDLKQDKLYQIVQRDETIGLQEVTIANISDTEGNVQPVPTEKKTVTDKRNEYRDTINPQLKKIREKKTKELEEKFGVEDDVDI